MDLSEISEIIVQVGGNDVSRNRNMDVIKEDFAEIISDLAHRSPNTKVLISEVTTRKTKKGENVDMSEINGTINDVCEMYGATLKLYCGYLYRRPCMINRICGLKQL